MGTAQAGAGQRVDVLIVTAVLLEYQAVLAVDTGAAPGASWQVERGPAGLDVAFRTFSTVDGGSLRIAATRALEMGGVATAASAAPLVTAYRPRCLAMCGVCAGRRGEVALGDVIIADRLWTYDTGALVVEKDDQGREVRRFKADPFSYNLDAAWRQKADAFVPEGAGAWRAARPRTYEDQIDWLLARLHGGDDPARHAERKQRCADYGEMVQTLWKRGWLEDGRMAITPAGREQIERKLLLYPDGLPEPEEHAVKVGPIGTGTQVVRDPGIFDKLSEHMRKVLGLEMEAAAIGAVAHQHEVPKLLVMKGVMDHADPDKSDNFKEFAARASAECLIAFVRAQLPAVGDGEDGILWSGTSPLPEKAGAAALLNARHQVVDFVGREELLGELRGWCEGEARVGARLIHAAGGMGKTRLAIELCKRMREVGWRAGFVTRGDTFGELVESELPVVAVIDYAESRPELTEMLKRVVGRRSRRALRILLLARNADDWWTDLLRSDGPVKDLLCDDPRGLDAVDVDRREVFRGAVRGIAEARHKPAPEGPLPSLSDVRYERALYVHMAALAVVEGREIKVEALMEDTLDHEERFWREQLRPRGREGERVALGKMRRAVSALTLIGGVGSAAEAQKLVNDEGIVMLLRDVYPGTGAQHIGGLEPDLLGEAMVWRVLSEEGTGAGPYLDRVFEGAGERAIRTGFEVLGRLSEDHKEADEWLAHVLGRDVAGRAMTAVAAARSVGERTAHAGLGPVLAKALERDGTVEIAKRLEATLPEAQQTVSLREVGRWVLEARLTHLTEGADEERAELLNNVSLWQSALGQREAALASTQEAAALRRRLAETRPDAFVPDLATSLNNLGILQSGLGQQEAALASTQEAVALYRRLAEARPDAFLPNLAMSLGNLGLRQNEHGQPQPALASAQEALDTLWPFFLAFPAAFARTAAMMLDQVLALHASLRRPPSPDLLQRRAALDAHLGR